VDEDGRQVRKLTLSPGLYSSLSWSPDRRSLAVALRRGSDQGIYVLSVDRPNVPRRILTGVAGNQAFAPAWSPEGKALAFTAMLDGNVDVYVVGADGSGLRRLTADPAIDVSPTWSPTGAFIAFVSDRGGKPNLYIVSTAGGSPRALTTEQFCDSPAWSVLNEIAYGSRTPRGTTIRIVKALASEPNTTEIPIGSSPTFSPDGQRIAFLGSGSDGGDVYTANRDGSGIHRIASGGRHRYLAWAE
jgi:TolB protein